MILLTQGAQMVLWIFIVLFLFGGLYSLYLHIRLQQKDNFEMDRYLQSDILAEEDSVIQLMEIIDNRIDLDITHALLPYSTTSNQIDPLKLDSISKTISEHVYGYFNKEWLSRFSDGNHIFNQEFWLSYIIKKTTYSLMVAYLSIRKKE